MKLIIIAAIVGLSMSAHAETSYKVSGKDATKLEALTTLIKDRNADVLKCSSQELTDKATMKNKKAPKVKISEK